jgi:hypothetical protein
LDHDGATASRHVMSALVREAIAGVFGDHVLGGGGAA